MWYGEERYHDRLQKGLCVYCGKKEATTRPDGTKLHSCDECRERRNANKQFHRLNKRRRLKHGDPVEIVGSYVKCKNCDVRINEYYYYCPWCGAEQRR